jgi:hypothetical protein
VLTVSATGLVTTVAEGAATLSARYSGQTGTRELTVGARLLDVGGTIVEKYGHLPISGATVIIADGPDAGKSALTAADGGFILTDLRTVSFTLRAMAPGFETEALAWSPNLPAIELEPLFQEHMISGTFPDPRFDTFLHQEDVPFITHHNGPVSMIFMPIVRRIARTVRC